MTRNYIYRVLVVGVRNTLENAFLRNSLFHPVLFGTTSHGRHGTASPNRGIWKIYAQLDV